MFLQLALSQWAMLNYCENIIPSFSYAQTDDDTNWVVQRSTPEYTPNTRPSPGELQGGLEVVGDTPVTCHTSSGTEILELCTFKPGVQ